MADSAALKETETKAVLIEDALVSLRSSINGLEFLLEQLKGNESEESKEPTSLRPIIGLIEELPSDLMSLRDRLIDIRGQYEEALM